MVGALLRQELLLDGRRNRQYYFRWLYAAWLIAQCGFLFLGHFAFSFAMRRRAFDYADFADFCNAYLEMIVTQHFLILLIVTPTLAAGSITDEKARGTLSYLLTAGLQPWEIVVGKLFGRTYPVLVLLLTGLPLVCFLGVFGGLDLAKLLALTLATVVLVFAVAALSLLASVLCRHTRDAVLGLYTVGVCGYLLTLLLHAFGGPGWLLHVLEVSSPLHPLGVGWSQAGAGELGRRVLISTAVWVSLGSLCLGLASALLRRMYLRYLEGTRPKKPRWWRSQRPGVGANPLVWKERHVEGVAPLAVLRNLPRWLGLLLVVVATVGSSGSILLAHLPPGVTLSLLVQMLWGLDWEALSNVWSGATPASRGFFLQSVWVMLLSTFVVGIRCSGAITGERERKTWEALLLTPLETRQLVRGKLWGILGALLPYLVAYAIPAVTLSLLGGFLAFFWTVVWLGVTCLAIAYVASAGLWCSVRSKGSWRSLLGTLGFTYLGGVVLYIVTLPLILLVWGIMALALTLLERYAGISLLGMFSGWFDAYYLALCLALAGMFVLLTWRLLLAAEYRVGILERIKHWKDEPRRLRQYPRRRRTVRYYD